MNFQDFYRPRMQGPVYTSDTETCARDVHPSDANASTLEHSASQHDGRTFALALSLFTRVKFTRNLSANARKKRNFAFLVSACRWGSLLMSCPVFALASLVSTCPRFQMWTLRGYEHTYRWKQFTFARKSCEQFSSHLLGLPSLQSKSQLFQQGVKCCAVVLIWYCKDAKHNSCQQQLATLKSQNCQDTSGERKRKNNKRTRNYAPKVNHNAICFQFRLFVPKGMENNSYAKFCGENKLHYEERERRKSL